MFVLDDIKSLPTSHAIKKEATSNPPAPRPVTTRSKSLGHKRNKAMEHDNDLASTKRHSHEIISDLFIHDLADKLRIKLVKDKVNIYFTIYLCTWP